MEQQQSWGVEIILLSLWKLILKESSLTRMRRLARVTEKMFQLEEIICGNPGFFY